MLVSCLPFCIVQIEKNNNNNKIKLANIKEQIGAVSSSGVKINSINSIVLWTLWEGSAETLKLHYEIWPYPSMKYLNNQKCCMAAIDKSAFFLKKKNLVFVFSSVCVVIPCS